MKSGAYALVRFFENSECANYRNVKHRHHPTYRTYIAFFSTIEKETNINLLITWWVGWGSNPRPTP